MKVVVTGASGFVGTRLVPFLQTQGHQVVPMGRDDLTTPDFAGADAVIHLAAIASSNGTDEASYIQVNRELPVRLAKEAAAQGVRRFVFLSTAHVISEPDTAYARSKAGAEHDLLAMSGIEVSIVRAPLVYGPGCKGSMRSLIRMSRIPLPLPFADAREKRSLIYLLNLCDALLFVTQKAQPGVYMAADSEAVSLAEIIGLCRQGIGRSPGLFSAPWLPWLLRKLNRGALERKLFSGAVYDTSALVSAGWSPPRFLLEALPLTAREEARR